MKSKAASSSDRKAKLKLDVMPVVIILGCASALLFILGMAGHAVNDLFYDGRPGWLGTSSALILSLGVTGIFASTLVFAGKENDVQKPK